MFDPNSGFAFVFQNANPSRIQASTDLVSWIDLGYATNQAGVLRFIDYDATNYPHRFYRLVSP